MVWDLYRYNHDINVWRRDKFRHALEGAWNVKRGGSGLRARQTGVCHTGDFKHIRQGAQRRNMSSSSPTTLGAQPDNTHTKTLFHCFLETIK
jgi:hypothetical protein